MQPELFIRGHINRIRLHVLPTKRFKTYSISVYAGFPLQESTVTSVALIPFVLRRGTRRFPDARRFREYLEKLYGSGFGFDVIKRGDYQIVQFRMDIVDDRLIGPKTPSMLEEAIAFIGEALTDPLTENGVFLSKYVEGEKETLRKRLASIINDKIRYAAERCIEEMCKDEPYRLNPLGRLDDLPSITSAGLYRQYQEWLKKAPIDVYVVGNADFEQTAKWVEKHFALDDNQAVPYQCSKVHVTPGEVKMVTERMEVSQGKLNLGLRSNITYGDERYPGLLVYNGLLGAYPHSKLFVNVREKASLAYYASSRVEGHKGIVTIQTGIEIENVERALDIIRDQLAQLERGEISELEMSQTKAMLSNYLRQMQDSPFDIIAFDFNTVLSGKERTIDQLIDQIGSIDGETIKEIAGAVKLDTVYFLRDRRE